MSVGLKLFKSNGVRVTPAVHRLISDANAARQGRDWTAAAAGYRAALDRDPELAHIWVQLGHALKESDDPAGAEDAYRRALRLKPDADTHLQLGRMRERGGDRAGAVRAYVAALRLDRRETDAASELQRLLALGADLSPEDLLDVMGPALDPLPQALPSRRPEQRLEAVLSTLAELGLALGDDEPGSAMRANLATASALIADVERSLRGRIATEQAGSRPLVFDVSDLVAYFHDNRLPTGIQRVQIEIICPALDGPAADRIQVCAYVAHRATWVAIPAPFILSICRLAQADGDRRAASWLAALTRLQVHLSVAEALDFPPGAALVNLGTSWWVPNYFLSVRQARTTAGEPVAYVPFVHDFIPLRAPDHCARGLVQDFVAWAVGLFDHADAFLVNSEATKRDLLEVAAALGRPVAADAVEVVRLDADPRRDLAGERRRASISKWGLAQNRYILFVATVEARKNHLLAFDAWLELIRVHGLKAVPKLVCVGKRGWLDDPIFAKVEAHETLRQRVEFLSGVSDADLSALYGGALFTLYPSTFEGWGLPVTESLCHGKVVLTSDGTSLPEAGGDFATYFKAGSLPHLVEALEQLLFDPDRRAAAEEKIAAGFHPRSWNAVADQVVKAVSARGANTSPRTFSPPFARLGAYHSLARNTEARIWRGQRSAEVFRADTGWWGQDDWGCWTSPEGGLLHFGVEAPHGPLRLYLRVHGLPSRKVSVHLEANGADIVVQPGLAPNEQRWIAVDLPAASGAASMYVVRLSGDDAEDLGRLTNGQDTRVIGVGLVGFFLCAADDAPARAAFSEAVALGTLQELAFDRAELFTFTAPDLAPAPPRAQAGPVRS